MYPLTIALHWRIGGTQDAVEAEILRRHLTKVQVRRTGRRVC